MAACTIGRGIQIRGNLSGTGDLVVLGRVEGNIALRAHVMVDEGGVVAADVEADDLTVRGRMRGDIDATGCISIASTGTLIGDLRAPRVVLEDGAKFQGRIEMDVPLPPGLL